MNRRTTLMLTGMTLGLAIAGAPHQAAFAQSDPLLGAWQVNLSKSKFSPGPPPRSLAFSLQAEGQNLKETVTGTDTSGNPINFVAAFVFDGMPHPTGNPNGDATAYTRVDAYTVIRSLTKAGKLVETLTHVVSPDGKTLTITTNGIDANGRPFNNIAVNDKQ
jgi:hypothetical protein